MKYRLVIFDFDGTLADSLPWLVSVMNQVAERYTFNSIDHAELETLRGYDAKRLMRHVGVPAWKIPMIASHVRTLMARDIGRIQLFTGTGEMLRRLADAGIVLALVSSNSDDNVRQVLGSELTGLIDHYECGVSMFGKQAKFRKILRRTLIPRDETLAIGDEVRDAEAARLEGIAFGAVTWGYATAAALAACSPAELFTSVDQIAASLA